MRLAPLFALLLAVTGVSARAGGTELAPVSCVAASETVAGALATPAGELDCGPRRFQAHARFVLVRSDLRRRFLPTGPLVWQTDPGLFDSLLLRLSWSDGSDSWIDIDPEVAAKSWAASSRIAIPLPEPTGERRLTAIDAIFENPRMIATLREGEIASAAAARESHFARSLAAMLAIGILLASIIYTLFFYRLMRARFMLWFTAMSLAMAGFVLTHTGLVFFFLPGLSLATRWQANALFFLSAITFAILFTLGLLEPGRLSRRWRETLFASLAVAVLARLPTFVPGSELGLLAGRYFTLALLPLTIALPAALIVALRRGSRAALFALGGFGVLALSGLLVMVNQAQILDLGGWTKDVMLAALVAMALACAAGVGDRFMVLRLALDRERSRAEHYGMLAFSDPLTGVGNRRAFDALKVLGAGQGLLLADLDRFKDINDRLGHRAGDEALARCARTLKRRLAERPGAAIYRVGGEEFAVVLDEADDAGLRALAEEIRAAVEADNVDAAGLPRLTISIGGCLGRGTAIEDACDEADAAMYAAKRMGRNRCRMAGDPEPDCELPSVAEWEERRSRI